VPVTINGNPGEVLKEANLRYGLGITANTVDCVWDGERMDLHMAVDGLISCDDDPIDEDGCKAGCQGRDRMNFRRAEMHASGSSK
jgi:hypothetical protein